MQFNKKIRSCNKKTVGRGKISPGALRGLKITKSQQLIWHIFGFLLYNSEVFKLDLCGKKEDKDRIRLRTAGCTWTPNNLSCISPPSLQMPFPQNFCDTWDLTTIQSTKAKYQKPLLTKQDCSTILPIL
jgi:hypothetical protein